MTLVNQSHCLLAIWLQSLFLHSKKVEDLVTIRNKLLDLHPWSLFEGLI